MEDIRVEMMEGLTEPQREAVTHVDGPMLVLAGPGSGKTTVVTRRIAWLIAQGIPAWQMLALTFTNKAAGEMRERVDRLVPEDVPGRRGLTVSTFHAFCARLLRRYADRAGLEASFTIYDASDQRDAVKRAIARADLNDRNFAPGAVLGTISSAKNRLIDAKRFETEATDFWSRMAARAFTAYQRILSDAGALDFDDLLLRVAQLLRQDEVVRDELRDRYQYLLIDEYQDTNHAQFVIAHELTGTRRNIVVVGDPDQSIYGWRGADIKNILDFELHYGDAKIVALGENFRSTGHIVAAADHLIQRNTQRRHKPLSTGLGDGAKPTVLVCRDETHEAETIVAELTERRGQPAADGGTIAWKDVAVLYRMNALSRVVEDALRSAHVPYVVARGTAFYERKEVKDALAYLRVAVNPRDEVSLRRVINSPPRGIGKTTLDRVEAYAIGRGLTLWAALEQVADVPGLTPRAVNAITKFVAIVNGWRAATVGETLLHETLGGLVERIVRESSIEAPYRQSDTEEDMERLANIEEVINAASAFDVEAATEGEGAASILQELALFLEMVALVSDADAIDPDRGAVTLMTLHAAKGLEFDVVVVLGLEEGLLPHSRAAASEDGLEEERRLCFVGMTRAKRHLILTRAGVRTHRGLRERTIGSTFLRELPEDSIDVQDLAPVIFEDDDFLSGGDEDPYGDDDASFPTGCLVRHPTFGVGRVQHVSRRARGSCAVIDFQSTGRKTLYLDYAPLERV